MVLIESCDVNSWEYLVNHCYHATNPQFYIRKLQQATTGRYLCSNNTGTSAIIQQCSVGHLEQYTFHLWAV